MSNSRLTTMDRTAFSVAFLSFAVSIALASRPLQKNMTSERLELNKISLRQSRDCEFACRACRFRLCEYDIDDETVLTRDNGALVILPTRSRVASYPWVCVEDSAFEVGLVKLTSEVTVQRDDGYFVKISSFKPSGLKNRFPKKIIATVPLNALAIPQFSGIAIGRSLHSDQKNALEGRCLILPIRKYQVLGRGGSVKHVKRVHGAEDCLGFKVTTKSPSVRIELHWTNQDDMDIYVKEPNEDIIGYRSPTSKTGGYLEDDVTLGDCLRNQEREAMEYIEWGAHDSPLRGQYEITVNHFESCHEGGLEWFLFVDVDGENFFFETGVHELKDGEENVDIDTFLIVLSS